MRAARMACTVAPIATPFLTSSRLGTLRHLPETRRRSELAIDIRIEIRNALLPLGDWVRAPDCMCVAKIVRCAHLNGSIAEGACDGERLLPEFESGVVVASEPPLEDHEDGDPSEPMLIAERPGEHLRLLDVISHAMTMYREMGMTYWLAQLEAELRQLG
jgi:hypothetical protein